MVLKKFDCQQTDEKQKCFTSVDKSQKLTHPDLLRHFCRIQITEKLEVRPYVRKNSLVNFKPTVWKVHRLSYHHWTALTV